MIQLTQRAKEPTVSSSSTIVAPIVRTTHDGVSRLATDAVAWAMAQLPFNAQNELERATAELYLLDQFAAVARRASKFEKRIRDGVRDGTVPVEQTFGDYTIAVSIGTPRTSFDKDVFVDRLVADYDLPRHKLVELATKCTRESAAPISIDVQYIGEERLMARQAVRS